MKEEGTMSGLNVPDQKLFDYCPRLKRFRQYVEQSYSGPISPEKAAGIAALESTYLSSYFRAKVGINFYGVVTSGPSFKGYRSY